MTSAARSLSEPEVLAHAKRRLFPPDGTETDTEQSSYVVADTQFAKEEWLPGSPVDPDIRARLAPFNHVRIGGGYPDLVGVARLESDLLAVERLGEEPPLIAIEAKGYASGGVDTRRGIVQAYDRLHEANAAYVAAPADAVSGTDRTLARELNVGVLGVEPTGEVEVLDVPRVVGNRTTSEAAALRFQAGSQGVANASFGLNHPKNYLGYPLAHDADGDTATLLTEHRVVSAVDDARRGAAFLGLIEDGPFVELTPLGREVVRFGNARCGSAEAALSQFSEWYQSRRRFVDLAPAWGQLARRVLFSYPATELLVTEIQTMHDDWQPEPSLVELVEHAHELHPTFTVELFIRSDETVRRRVLTDDGSLRQSALEDGSVYHSPTVFQLKAMLYHAGILTERGREPHRLEPTEDVWALRQPV
ncbi:hypothetical protein EA462_01525 [Natrarchaeobius halalkaliphilus]|uniref:Uncharacterized protein n=1 Tax=Natrarchaeobius halalkaliphilus TaxID=1679091 RepID=A0A3N6MAC9_9EURY|nr:hypothetical protein [Natrarchaeobius halalkaliphilus]RQG93290.1 hypothetical protein EA462_01525 [Natrarchaeobius halalkaliphilus]